MVVGVVDWTDYLTHDLCWGLQCVIRLIKHNPIYYVLCGNYTGILYRPCDFRKHIIKTFPVLPNVKNANYLSKILSTSITIL